LFIAKPVTSFCFKLLVIQAMLEKGQFISQLIAAMPLEQKVGQCFVIGFCGTVVTPAILQRIRKIKPAGMRVGLTFRSKTALHDPSGTSEIFAHRVHHDPQQGVKDIIPGILPPHCTNEEYCAVLNTLKSEALKNENGIPLHITMDMEGDVSCDYTRGGIFYFPAPLGTTVSGNPQIAYDVAWATGRQLHALGVMAEMPKPLSPMAQKGMKVSSRRVSSPPANTSLAAANR
jgi:beta-glucosidase-like glycosyl hydrolase